MCQSDSELERAISVGSKKMRRSKETETRAFFMLTVQTKRTTTKTNQKQDVNTRHLDNSFPYMHVHFVT